MIFNENIAIIKYAIFHLLMIIIKTDGKSQIIAIFSLDIINTR